MSRFLLPSFPSSLLTSSLLHRYTYSITWFGEAQQKSNNNNMRTSLGRFKGFSQVAEKGSDEYYLKQLYAEGQRCWNGPARSAKVSSFPPFPPLDYSDHPTSAGRPCLRYFERPPLRHGAREVRVPLQGLVPRRLLP